MSRGSLNKVMLIGNLGADPETRYTPSNMAITKIRIATSETWKDKNTGENQERTEWHRVTLFGRLGEISQQYLRKGSKVYIEGQLRTNKWQGQDGQDRYTTEIEATEMQMLGGRPSGERSGPPAERGGWSDDGFSTPKPAARPAAAKPAESFADNDPFGDDVPF